jgi:hypothetical protein
VEDERIVQWRICARSIQAFAIGGNLGQGADAIAGSGVTIITAVFNMTTEFQTLTKKIRNIQTALNVVLEDNMNYKTKESEMELALGYHP